MMEREAAKSALRDLGIHTDNGQDVPQSAVGGVVAGMDGNNDRPTVGMAQYVMASAGSRPQSPRLQPGQNHRLSHDEVGAEDRAPSNGHDHRNATRAGRPALTCYL